ncbi:MAG: acyl--CoA ligase [Spirochaetales bacterium]|nr:acyl--CoA ligase [Spirochaetales bacterium]
MKKSVDFLNKNRGKFFTGNYPSLSQLFSIVATNNPGNIFLTEASNSVSKSWSYSEAEREIKMVAADLINRGFMPGDKAMLVGTNSAEWIFAFFAIQYAGGTAVLADFHNSFDNVDEIMSGTEIKLFFLDSEVVAKVSKNFSVSSDNVISLTPGTNGYLLDINSSPDIDFPGSSCDDSAIINFVSDSSVLNLSIFTQGDIVKKVFEFVDEKNLTRDDVIYTNYSFFHNETLERVVFPSIFNVATLVVGFYSDTESLVKMIGSENISVFFSSSAFFNEFLVDFEKIVRKRSRISLLRFKIRLGFNGFFRFVFRTNLFRPLFKSTFAKHSILNLRALYYVFSDGKKKNNLRLYLLGVRH